MVAQASSAIDEAQGLGLFTPHGAFEVHCSNCHSRLGRSGDCPTCGLIGRPVAEVEKRMGTDPAGTAKLLRDAIAKRRAYKPVKS